MHCQSCGSSIPEGSTSCPACKRSAGASGEKVGVGSLTPPDSVTEAEIQTPATDLAARLQEALGTGYRVETVIGTGGFASVYRVRDLTLKRALAVKVLAPELVASATALARFRREAETIAQLSHPNIVPVHFVGGEGDLFYLAMAFVDGASLAACIARDGALSVEDVTRIMKEIASALHYAHRRGVVHRDVKPHNVLIERETERALLTDFGIARTAESASLTATGAAIGTPAYMSPEQVSGEAVDHRSDIYALGIVGYEMLTAQVPFTGPSPTAVMLRRLSQVPAPITSVRSDIPKPLADVVMRCLASDPEQRFQDAGTIVEALERTTPVSGGHSTAELVQRGRRARWSGLAAAAAAAAVLAVVFLARRTRFEDAETASPPLTRPAAPQVTSASVPNGMVRVPAGTYQTGTDDGPPFSRPVHMVSLAVFAIEKTEVTVASYKAFVDATGTAAPWRTELEGGLPVAGATWAEANAYCRWRYGDGRLPTEQEWEAAARGLNGFRYPWGDVWEPGAANTASSGRSGAAPAGSFPAGANPAGVHDLIGNVWEWTSSRMAAYPGGTAPAQGERYYVIRGGAYNTPDSLANATHRGYLPPTTRDRSNFAQTGFRCVTSLP